MTQDLPENERVMIPAGRVAGVDYGRKRIGIAICDAQRIVSSPFCVRQSTGDTVADATFFCTLVASEDIVGFVVGLPVHADGSNSQMSVEVERFGQWLAAVTSRPVVFQDERYSSIEATGLMAGRGLSRGKKKARVDALAAQIVLSAWLETQSDAVVACSTPADRPRALDA
ncbi:MAG: Holliday junction resolvase RuvX [Planctomycetia bacterium]|nr:Holliday junction resolvase RuvX [Planctomycetia bacterium]